MTQWKVSKRLDDHCHGRRVAFRRAYAILILPEIRITGRGGRFSVVLSRTERVSPLALRLKRLKRTADIDGQRTDNLCGLLTVCVQLAREVNQLVRMPFRPCGTMDVNVSGNLL